MFRRDFMPRTDNTAFKQGESRFDGISVNVSANIFAGSDERSYAYLYPLQL